MPKAFDPTESLVLRMVLLHRVANGLSRDVRLRFERLFAEIETELRALDPTAVDSAVFQRARIVRLVERVREISEEVAAEALSFTRSAAARIGSAEAKWAASMLERSLGTLTIDITPGIMTIARAKQILDTDPVLGVHLADAFEMLGEKIAVDFRREVQMGMTASETIADIVARVRGTSDGSGGFTGGIMETTTRNAESLVRTAVSDISNSALMETWEENDDVVDGWRFVASLGEGTCLECGAMDGKEFDLGEEPGSVPPLHRRCRCTSVPRIAWEKLGLTPPKPGERAAEGGPVSATMDFEGWLSKQGAETQDGVLGPARGELFRRGEVSLRDLVRGDGSVIPLEDLS